MRIAVYCSSSQNIDSVYFDVARQTGRIMAENGHELIYGGGSVGLMGAIAEEVYEGGGNVFGVIPERLKEKEGLAYHLADELIVTQTMQKRKATMYKRANAFLALPGGMGTLEEFMEVVTLRQLGYHDKPIVLLNADGFYDKLIAFFEQLHEQNFTHQGSHEMFEVVRMPAQAIQFIEQYEKATAEATS